MILGSNQEFASPTEALEHHGVKGQRWGVRKEEPITDKNTKSQQRKATAKKVAIGAGILATVAGGAFVVYKLNQSGKLPFKSIKDVSSTGKKATESILKEPTDIIHATSGHSIGFKFIRKGGLPDALGEYDRAGFSKNEALELFKRYGNNSEKIAARFPDPLGRRDFAGRVLPHELIVPKSMSSNIHSLDDVKSKVWPLLSDFYTEFYNSSIPEHLR